MGVLHELDSYGQALCGPRAVVQKKAKRLGWPPCCLCACITKRALRRRKDLAGKHWPDDWGRIKDKELDTHGRFA